MGNIVVWYVKKQLANCRKANSELHVELAKTLGDLVKARQENAALVEATKRLLCHVGLHGMPTVALEQDAEFAESVLARAESAEGEDNGS